jgi:hypothetical protein
MPVPSRVGAHYPTVPPGMVEGAVVYSQVAQARGLRVHRFLGEFAVVPFEAIPRTIS